ncbi:hypothetical protein FOZ61_010487 [Perkinsus olseni]|uniref:Uncharacterized protein n=1 Tax=Perkinsus olseni TaxID=32597 RepID=A0A7J6M9L3_PEROL|nr:hypothetical protein FOZ61_010487 [Perkinsus olseni]KAF4668086.1 hypothetical protein FOL46_002151 [Perkinsus olseni]
MTTAVRVDEPSPSHPLRQGSCEMAVVTVETRTGKILTTAGPVSFDWARPHHLGVDSCRIRLSGPFRVVVQDKSDLGGAKVDPDFCDWASSGMKAIEIDICEAPDDFFDGLHSFLVYAGGRHRLSWDPCGAAESNFLDHFCDALDTLCLRLADKAVCCVFQWADRVAEAFGADDLTPAPTSVRSIGTDAKEEVETAASTSSSSREQRSDESDTDDAVLVSRKESTPTLTDSEVWQDCTTLNTADTYLSTTGDVSTGDGRESVTEAAPGSRAEARELVTRTIGLGLMMTPIMMDGGSEDDVQAVLVDCDVSSEFCEVDPIGECDSDTDSDCESWVAL